MNIFLVEGNKCYYFEVIFMFKYMGFFCKCLVIIKVFNCYKNNLNE